MSDLDAYSLDDLKLCYRVLHAQLMSEPGLLDSQLLSDAQARLQRAARAAGVDVSDHAQWAAWLGGAAPTQRRPLA